MSIEYSEVKQLIEGCLPEQVDLQVTDNLIEMGINSLKIMRLLNQWRKKGIRLSFAELMEEPTLEAWWNLICEKAGVSQFKKVTVETIEKEEMKPLDRPFPLTDVQYGYWIGRRDEQSLGGVGCHAYLEFDGENVNPKKLEDAWNQLQTHHRMLRTRFLEDGTQEVMKQPFSNTIQVHDFTNVSDDEELRACLHKVRDELSHRKLRVEEGEVAGITLSCLPKNQTRIHLDLDLLVADVQSLQIILRDLANAYNGGALPEFSGQWDFGGYLKKQSECEKEELKKAEDYWKKRLTTLPNGPALPLAKRPEEVAITKFNRRSIRLSVLEWDMLLKKAASYHITPAIMLLTAYATILERWSANKKFLINMPMFNRNTEEQGLEDVVADFTTLLLLEVNFEEQRTFSESLAMIQKQIYDDMQYAKYSGVQVQRDLARIHGGQNQTAPIVFACNVGTPLLNQNFVQSLGKYHYMISQTPQVWLDFQSYEDDEGLLLTWDTVDELFPEGMIDDMLSSLERLLHQLGEEAWEQVFDVLPRTEQETIAKEIVVESIKQPQCLHDGFFVWAERTPEAVALIDTGKQRQFTYHDLEGRVTSVASGIVKEGIFNQPIAIMLPRGYEQVEAALAVMASGNYYVPINENQPIERMKLILEKTGIQCILTSSELRQKVNLPEYIHVFELEVLENESAQNKLPKVSPEASAYIIMTSGSTGLPKGVEISHQSAWNTIATINEQYEITKEDAAFAISSIDFDLSVYDMFGLLSVGGRLILIPEEEKRNAAYWVSQVKAYNVTIWNSVPVLLDMLLISAKSEQVVLPLRVVMLSGDWIGLDLPKRLQEQTTQSRLVAMGGATEASIWSNYKEVELPLPTYWKSIPYGQPLSGQSYRVVDCLGRDCPSWVEGELWIGGYGVAQRYRGDEALTKVKFVEDTYGRWYRTGDEGRHWRDRTIEFLGRQDNQVKVRGHRIELGEIEHAITSFDGVHRAVVDTVGEQQGEKYLVAYVEAGLDRTSGVAREIRAKKEMEQIWQELVQNEIVMDNEVQTSYEQFVNFADNQTLRLIQSTLEELGAIDSMQVSVEEFVENAKIEEKWTEVIRSWFRFLKEYGEIRKEVAHYPELDTYFEQLAPHLVNLLRGEEEPLAVFYEEGKKLSPNDLLNCLPGQSVVFENLLKAVKTIVQQHNGKEPLHILEIGTRNSGVSKKVLELMSPREVVYEYVDVSPFFLEQAQKELEEYSFVQYGIWNPDISLQEQNGKLHYYDCIIAYNSLHRTNDASIVTKQIADMLAPGGIICSIEITEENYLQQLATVFLEEGFSHIVDLRKEHKSAILTSNMWEHYFGEQDFHKIQITSQLCGCSFIVGQMKETVLSYTDLALQDYLAEKLPEYMIPKVYHFFETLPVTSNGKIDRKKLKNSFQTEVLSNEKEEATIETEKKLLEIWKCLFKNKEIGITDNFFSLGGDSLIATRMLSEIEKVFSVKLKIKAIFEQGTIKQLAARIDSQTITEQKNTCVMKPNRDDINVPFPLTDVQYAYWIGRSGLYDLGNVSTHVYFELDGEGLECEKLQWAWNQLITRHDMMRAVIQSDGRQCILKDVPEYEIRVYDWKQCTDKVREDELLKVRQEMSHQVLGSEHWPLFDVRVCEIGHDKQRIHISFDNLMFDGWSMFHLLSEWTDIYRTGNVAERPSISFRDYVLALDKVSTEEVLERDKEYWESRIEEFSSAPELPLAKMEKEITNQRFRRRTGKLEPVEWLALRKMAKEMQITPSVLLMSAYAEVLRVWSLNKNFTINLTQFDRKPLHPEVGELIGDFTTLTLLEIKELKESTFAQRAKAIQEQLLKDLEHDSYSAIELERQIGKLRGGGQGAVMPIVFTSGLGIEQWNSGKWLGELHYNISQTPQVWLDHQVIEKDQALYLFWDSVDELFHEGMLDEMFQAYTTLLKSLAQNAALFYEKRESLVVAPISKLRAMANETEASILTEDTKTLDGMFLKAARQYPDKEAIVTTKRRVTYRELLVESSGVAEQLMEQGVGHGELVAIMMEKGWEQIVSVYGVLFAGAVYLPIDIHNPKERILKVLEDSKTKVILVQEGSFIDAEEDWLKEYTVMPVNRQKTESVITETVNHPEDLAYVIYTSGTTGLPKGVMISHQGAINTIVDVNQRWNVTHEDTAIGVSQLHFDLSVYDIFGMLAAGGTLVIPDAELVKEPSHWIELMNQEYITVWNSVPAFVEMLVEYESYQQKLKNKTLRLVLMSGDWIPTKLPVKIQNLFADVKMIGMGGATEASIWSNFFEIPERIPDEWKSIPYGKPLSNQKYYILDKGLNNCPDWVPGQIYIGGEGVAKGYFNDPSKTAEKFIVHPETKERIYATGDMGRYWTTGDIEFLGRMDTQVKRNGYRIELGEIEAALSKIQEIKECIVVYEKEQDELKAYMTVQEQEQTIQGEEVAQFLEKILPSYMVPKYFYVVKEFPLTQNGKVDRQQLSSLEKVVLSKNITYAETDKEKELLKIWNKILGKEIQDVNESFFEAGGDSIKIIHLVNEINRTYHKEINLAQANQFHTIKLLAQYLEEQEEEYCGGVI